MEKGSELLSLAQQPGSSAAAGPDAEEARREAVRLATSTPQSAASLTVRSSTAVEPPPYSGPATVASSVVQHSVSSSKQFRAYPGLPRIDYRLYGPPLFELSEDCTHISTRAQYLSADAGALASLIRAQASVPPKPQVRIVGSRGRKVDFDIKLNLMGLLVPEDESRHLNYIRCVGEGELAFRGGLKKDVLPQVGDGGLEEWCRRFVEDPSAIKSFSLDRVVANMDTGWIDGQLRSLVSTTNYQGVVRIEWPTTHAKVLVQNPDRINKFFTSVSSLFSGRRRFEVVQAVWPFATGFRQERDRRCVVQSEEVWFAEWQASIKYAVATKRHGWVTNEDKLEALMEGKGIKGLAHIDWGPDF